MKTVEKERIEKVKETLYVAADGTEFYSSAECEKYEESALGLMRAKIKPLMSKPKDAWQAMGGSEGNQVVAVSMKNEKDVDTVIQWFFLECPWYLNDSLEERKEEILKIIHNAFDTEDVLLFGLNTEEGYYFINSRNNIICNLTMIDKPNEDDKG